MALKSVASLLAAPFTTPTVAPPQLRRRKANVRISLARDGPGARWFANLNGLWRARPPEARGEKLPGFGVFSSGFMNSQQTA